MQSVAIKAYMHKRSRVINVSPQYSDSGEEHSTNYGSDPLVYSLKALRNNGFKGSSRDAMNKLTGSWNRYKSEHMPTDKNDAWYNKSLSELVASPGGSKWLMDHNPIDVWKWGEELKGPHTAYVLNPTDTINDIKAQTARYIYPVSTAVNAMGHRQYIKGMSAKDIGSEVRDKLTTASTPSSGPNWFDRFTMAITGAPFGMYEGVVANNRQVDMASVKNRLWNLFKKNPLDTAGGFFEGATGLNRKWLWGGLGGLGALGALGIGAYLMRNRQQPVQYTQLPQYPMGSWQQNALNSYIRQPYMGQ